MSYQNCDLRKKQVILEKFVEDVSKKASSLSPNLSEFDVVTVKLLILDSELTKVQEEVEANPKPEIPDSVHKYNRFQRRLLKKKLANLKIGN